MISCSSTTSVFDSLGVVLGAPASNHPIFPSVCFSDLESIIFGVILVLLFIPFIFCLNSSLLLFQAPNPLFLQSPFSSIVLLFGQFTLLIVISVFASTNRVSRLVFLVALFIILRLIFLKIPYSSCHLVNQVCIAIFDILLAICIGSVISALGWPLAGAIVFISLTFLVIVVVWYRFTPMREKTILVKPNNFSLYLELIELGIVGYYRKHKISIVHHNKYDSMHDDFCDQSQPLLS